MDRRGFLRSLGLVLPVAAVAPTYFFAPIGGWKSTIITNPNLLSMGNWYIPRKNEWLYDVFAPNGGISIGTIRPEQLTPNMNRLYHETHAHILGLI